jgi:hypothetical protein
MRRHTRQASNAQDADARTCELNASSKSAEALGMCTLTRSSKSTGLVGWVSIAGSVCWAFAEVAGEAQWIRVPG